MIMWLQEVYQRLVCQPARRQTRRRHGARLGAEQLEDRQVLSNFTAATVSHLVADINAANRHPVALIGGGTKRSPVAELNAANRRGGPNIITLTAPATSPRLLTLVNNTKIVEVAAARRLALSQVVPSRAAHAVVPHAVATDAAAPRAASVHVDVGGYRGTGGGNPGQENPVCLDGTVICNGIKGFKKGQATPLGDITSATWQIDHIKESKPGKEIYEGSATFGAHGNSITIRFQAVGNPVSGKFDARYSIVGGTGEYKGATGRGTIKGKVIHEKGHDAVSLSIACS
jgi:hypothetical protein